MTNPLHPIFTRSGPGRYAATGGRKHGKKNHRHLVTLLVALACAASAVVGLATVALLSLDIPEIRSVAHYRPPVASRILDRKDRLIDTVFLENRLVIPLEKIPGFLSNAFVAAEDDRFFQHSGVDPTSILRALYHNLMAGARSQGGSTITQQVARSLLLSREKTYLRKLKEAILAYRIDKNLTKDEILHIYLNQIYLGSGAYGVQAASRTYFDKDVSQLSKSEMALLAGLPQAPSRYSPLINPDAARSRQQYVVGRMMTEGFVGRGEAEDILSRPLVVRKQQQSLSEASYFMQQVQAYVEEKYGRGMLATGGLTVRTTLDLDIQRAAARALRQQLLMFRVGAEIPQGGVAVLESTSGRVRALVGGRNFASSQFDRAVQARRQPGSALKPVIFAAAFEYGMAPETIVIDAPLHLTGAANGTVWSPENYTRKHYGPTTLQQALVHSRNVVTVKIMQEIGVDRVKNLAQRLGIASPLAGDLSLALGSSGVTLLELTAAYSAFANSGIFYPPLFISRVEDWQGRTLEENSPRPIAALPRRVAQSVDAILHAVVREGTGRKALGAGSDIAGKTGTSSNNKDAWFIGYTPKLLAGVWVGFDANTSLGAGGTGGMVAAPIWSAVIRETAAFVR